MTPLWIWVALFGSAVSAARTCKAIPESAEWPSESVWTNFNQTNGGVLLKPFAPAAACHPGPAQNAELCLEVKARWNSSQWHSENPSSSLWQNWNNYSCMPTGATCSADGYPIYVINASTPEHVKAGVAFAREKKLRLNIKSTGHDFLGRSVSIYYDIIFTSITQRGFGIRPIYNFLQTLTTVPGPYSLSHSPFGLII